MIKKKKEEKKTSKNFTNENSGAAASPNPYFTSLNTNIKRNTTAIITVLQLKFEMRLTSLEVSIKIASFDDVTDFSMKIIQLKKAHNKIYSLIFINHLNFFNHVRSDIRRILYIMSFIGSVGQCS